jgi:hypothetical protein
MVINERGKNKPKMRLYWNFPFQKGDLSVRNQVATLTSGASAAIANISASGKEDAEDVAAVATRRTINIDIFFDHRTTNPRHSKISTTQSGEEAVLHTLPTTVTFEATAITVDVHSSNGGDAARTKPARDTR